MGSAGTVKRVCLAYSGGLDTSVILRWLIEEYGCEVVAYCADVGQEDELDWFYGDVGGLERLPDATDSGGRVRFRSAHLELRIDLVDRPRTEGVGCRVTLLVPSLEETMADLDERTIHYVWLRDLMWTSRRIETHDPAGNRVAFKQEWPYAPL